MDSKTPLSPQQIIHLDFSKYDNRYFTLVRLHKTYTSLRNITILKTVNLNGRITKFSSVKPLIRTWLIFLKKLYKDLYKSILAGLTKKNK